MNEIKDLIDSIWITSNFKTRFEQILAMMIEKDEKKKLITELINDIREAVKKRFPEKYEQLSIELDQMESKLKKI